MDKQRKQIDDFFREKMGHYAEVPPSDAWADMDKRLDMLKPATVPTNPYRWMGHFGMVSVVAILGVTAVNYFSASAGADTEAPSPIAAAVTPTSPSPGVDQTVPTTDNIINTVDVETIAPIANATGKSSIVEQEPPRHEQLAFGESYSDNADEEYVEGVTPIHKEDINDTYEPGHGRERSVQHVLAADGSGALLAYSGNDVLNAGGPNGGKTSNRINGTQNLAAGGAKEKSAVTFPPQSAENGTKADKLNAPRFKESPWEIGVNAGYERGFSNAASRSIAIAPWVGYKVSKRFSIVAQPTLKFANAPVRQIGASQMYYTTSGDASVEAVESYVTSAVEGTRVTYYNNTRYRYTQQYNTTQRRNMTGGSYRQLELPVSAAYRLAQRVKIYGGVNLVFSKSQNVQEHVSGESGLIATRDSLITTTGTPVAPNASDVLQFPGAPGATYTGPAYSSERTNMLRVGASAGVSWQYSNRWLLDAMVQQTPAPAQMRGGYNVNAPMSAPVFRLSVGYKIVK